MKEQKEESPLKLDSYRAGDVRVKFAIEDRKESEDSLSDYMTSLVIGFPDCVGNRPELFRFNAYSWP